MVGGGTYRCQDWWGKVLYASTRLELAKLSDRTLQSYKMTQAIEETQTATADPLMAKLSSATESIQDSKEPTREPKLTTPRHEEYQYLDLIRDILENGEHRPDR
jgi:hypothetical protein